MRMNIQVGIGSEIQEEYHEGHGMPSEDLGLYPEALRVTEGCDGKGEAD